jgi:hypothetical protein
VEEECTFHADTVTGDTTDGEIEVVSTPAQANDYALKNLNTFTVAFDNANMHLDGVTGRKFRMFRCFGL